MKLLLHCCCAPCSIACIKNLCSEEIDMQLFWYNPNIHPFTEYKNRLDCFTGYAQSKKLNYYIDDEYGLRSFLKETFNNLESRCQICYWTRLYKTAFYAVQNNFSAFSTTLLISPYQDHGMIKRIGEEIAAVQKIDFFYRDFRPFFSEGKKKARESGMYMQKYCGCIFSEEERYHAN
jgi:hypothetical protein